MTLALVSLFVVLAVAISFYKWRAHNAEVRSLEALEQQRKLATERLERAILGTQDKDPRDTSKARRASASTGM